MNNIIDYIPTTLLSTVLVVVFVYTVDKYIQTPVLKTIPSIPGYPIVGNYFQVTKNPALVFTNWTKSYGHKIFQIRLGKERIVVVNYFDDVSSIWKISSVNSRPIQHTFHNIVSSTKGFTIGTTPFGESYKRRKQFISSRLNSKSIYALTDIIDHESTYMFKNILLRNRELRYQPSTTIYRTFPDLNLMEYFQFFHLRTSILITYGFKLDCFGDDYDLSKRIIDCENKIIRFRSPVSNVSDYFPILRKLWTDTATTLVRQQRDEYMKELLNRYLQRSFLTNDFAYNLLDEYYQSHETNHSKALTQDELQSICLTMISAGLDNTPLNLNHLLGQLSYHPNFQIEALNELISSSNKKQSLITIWNEIPNKMQSPLIQALIKETLRYFTVLPLSLPRVVTRDFVYKGMYFSSGTTLFMNAYFANHDPEKFRNPNNFNPYRWLDKEGNLLSPNLINHFSFGKGVRMCSGNILAFKEMYIIISRLILLFEIKMPQDESLKMILDPFKANKYPKATSFEPYEFKVRFVPRVMSGSDDLHNHVLSR